MFRRRRPAAPPEPARPPLEPVAEDRRGEEQPLIIRIRRDGTVALMSKTFPRRHEFPVAWLMQFAQNGHVVVADETVTLTFANATGVYRIESVDADRGVLMGVLESESGSV